MGVHVCCRPPGRTGAVWHRLGRRPVSRQSPPDPDAKLARDQLEGYLWSAADILRGSIDSSDYKNFIFGLLFLKRLTDRFEDECEEFLYCGGSSR